MPSLIIIDTVKNTGTNTTTTRSVIRNARPPKAAGHSRAGHLSNTRQPYLSYRRPPSSCFSVAPPPGNLSYLDDLSIRYSLHLGCVALHSRHIGWLTSINPYTTPFFPFPPSFCSVFIWMFLLGKITRLQGNAALRCIYFRSQTRTVWALAPAPRSIFEMSSISRIPGYTLHLNGTKNPTGPCRILS